MTRVYSHAVRLLFKSASLCILFSFSSFNCSSIYSFCLNSTRIVYLFFSRRAFSDLRFNISFSWSLIFSCKVLRAAFKSEILYVMSCT